MLVAVYFGSYRKDKCLLGWEERRDKMKVSDPKNDLISGYYTQISLSGVSLVSRNDS